MRKITTILFGAVLLLMASCAEELLNTTAEVAEEDYVDVNVTVNIDADLMTRTYGDGSIERLRRFLYCNGVCMEDSTFTKQNYSKSDPYSFAMRLVKDQDYKLIFFGDRSGSSSQIEQDAAKCYYVTLEASAEWGAGSKTGDYISGGDQTNSDFVDVFYVLKEIRIVSGDTTYDTNISVELTRCSAQFNLGTNDLDEIEALYTGFDMEKANYYLSLPAGLHGVLDLLNNKLIFEYQNRSYIKSTWKEDKDGEIVLTYAPPFLQGEVFPVSDEYDYLLMQYLLAPEEMTYLDGPVYVAVQHSALPEVDSSVDTQTLFGVKNEEGNRPHMIIREITEPIPYQRNYRTNIFGSLFTTGNLAVTTSD